jgi:hypothetical protein
MTRSLSVFLLFIVVYFCASVTVADIVTNPTTMPLQKHAQLRGPQGPGAKRAVRASEEARHLQNNKSNRPQPPQQQQSQQPHHPQQQQAPKLTPKAQQQKPMLVQQPKNKQPPHQPVNVATKAVRAVKASKGISKQPTGREPSILQVEDLNHLDFSMSHFTDKLANKKSNKKTAVPQQQKVKAVDAIDLTEIVSKKPLIKHTVPELKEILRCHGLPVGGVKDELIKRLEQYAIQSHAGSSDNDENCEQNHIGANAVDRAFLIDTITSNEENEEIF